MENQVDDRSISFRILRFVKISRIILLVSIILIQFYFVLVLKSVYYFSSITASCFIVVLDLAMFNKRKDQFKEFYLVSVIICLSAIGMITMVFFPLLLFPYITDYLLALFYLLGFGVMIVSLIELLTLIYLTRPQEDYNEEIWKDKEEVWDGKKDTIEIQ